MSILSEAKSASGRKKPPSPGGQGGALELLGPSVDNDDRVVNVAVITQSCPVQHLLDNDADIGCKEILE